MLGNARQRNSLSGSGKGVPVEEGVPAEEEGELLQQPHPRTSSGSRGCPLGQVDSQVSLPQGSRVGFLSVASLEMIPRYLM